MPKRRARKARNAVVPAQEPLVETGPHNVMGNVNLTASLETLCRELLQETMDRNQMQESAVTTSSYGNVSHPIAANREHSVSIVDRSRSMADTESGEHAARSWRHGERVPDREVASQAFVWQQPEGVDRLECARDQLRETQEMKRALVAQTGAINELLKVLTVGKESQCMVASIEPANHGPMDRRPEASAQASSERSAWPNQVRSPGTDNIAPYSEKAFN